MRVQARGAALALACLISGCAGLSAGTHPSTATPDRTAEALAAPAPSASAVVDALAAWDARFQGLVEAFDVEHGSPRPHDRDWVAARLAFLASVDQVAAQQLYFARPGWSTDTAAAYHKRFERERWSTIREDMQVELSELIGLHGWFEPSAWSEETRSDAWLIVQHADNAVAFQALVLAMLQDSCDATESDAVNCAYLHDRVMKNTGRLQRYGTQGRCVGPGLYEPYVIEDPVAVDSLRRGLGLEPLDDYVQATGRLCQ